MKKTVWIIILFWGFILLKSEDTSLHIYGFISVIIAIFSYVNHKLEQPRSALRNDTIADNTNCAIYITLQLMEILDHPILKKYFSHWFDKKTHANIKKSAEKMIEESIIKNKIQINIKKWNIYKDWELVFEDNIYHAIFIPYGLKSFKEEHFSRRSGITIRLVLVNGSLNLQLGEFNPETFNIVKTTNIGDQDYKTYKSFYTLVSIPLLYQSPLLGISRKHLNIVAEWIEEYHLRDATDKEKIWVEKWQELHRDLYDYLYLISTKYEDPADDRSIKIMNSFQKKSRSILLEQGIELETRDDDYYDRVNFWYIEDIHSKFMDLRIIDLNSWFHNNYQKDSSSYTKEEFYP